MEELDLERGRPLGDAIERGRVDEVRHAVQVLGLSVDAPVASLRYHAGRVHPLFLALDLFPDPISPTPLTLSPPNDSRSPSSSSSALPPGVSASESERTDSSTTSSSTSKANATIEPSVNTEAQDRWAVFAYLLSKRPMLNAPLPSLHGLVGNALNLLHYACMSASRLPHVRLLLKYGAHVNAADSYGWTPLHWAAFKGHTSTVQLLIKAGANLHAECGDMERPLEKAIRGGHRRLFSVLRVEPRSTLQPAVILQHNVKIVLLGETACGKTSMMDRLRYNHFEDNTEPTVGGVMHTKSFHLNTVQYKTCIVDIGGQKRYQSLSPVYYRDAAVCIVVFDLTRIETFERAKDWVTELQLALPPHTVIVMAGNKAERQHERQINLRSARSFASDKSLMYFEVSVNTGRFVYDLFVYSLKIYRQIVGQYSKTADVPMQQKVASRVPASHVCFFEEIRAGRRVLYKHPSHLLHQPSKEGYLTKQGHFITNWKQRWFVVAGDILYYYRDPHDEIPAGVILLRGCMIHKKSGPGIPAFCFALELNETWLVDPTSTSNHEQYLLTADSLQSMQSWIDAIERARLQALELRASLTLNNMFHYVQSTVPIVADRYDDRVSLDVSEGRLHFRKQSFLGGELFQIPLQDGLHVYQDPINTNLFLLTDCHNFRFFVSDAESGLMSYLKQNLPGGTGFDVMTPLHHLENFVIAYQYACERLRVPLLTPLTRMISRAVKTKDPTLRQLDLSGVPLTGQDVEAIMHGLSFYPYCETLNLHDTNLDDHSLYIIAQELCENKKIRNLKISCNKLTDDAGSHIEELLRRRTGIREIRMGGNCLTSGAIARVFTALASDNQSVRVFDISHSHLSDTVVRQALLKLISVRSPLTHFICTHNGLSAETGHGVLKALAKENQTLLVLDMRHNQFTPVQLGSIEQLLQRNQERARQQQKLESEGVGDFVVV
mmetsp:Transcript_5413/g.13614  ORF Transcript_5413/g.13614 Transcript_5413/m.13614 type:complete len:947 (+) Transcript_5413:68-2908(+)